MATDLYHHAHYHIPPCDMLGSIADVCATILVNVCDPEEREHALEALVKNIRASTGALAHEQREHMN